MKFRFAHNNFNVLDLERSLKFYEEALGFSASQLHGKLALSFSDGGQTQHELEAHLDPRPQGTVQSRRK